MITVSAELQQLAVNPIRRPSAQVYFMWDGVNWTDESARLKNVSGFEEMGGGLFESGISEADIEFYNEDFHFSLGHSNCSITEDQMIPKVRVKILIGFNDVNITRFTGYVNTYTPDTKAGVFRVHAFDGAYLLKHIPSGYEFFTDYTISELVTWVATKAGLSASLTDIEETTQEIGFAYFEDRSLWFILCQLAAAEGGRVFFDQDGKLCFWNRSHISFASTPVYTFTHEEEILDQPYELSDKDIKNLIRIKSEARAVYETQKVWDITEASADEYRRVYAYNGDENNDLQFIVVPENPVTEYERPLVAYTDYEANSEPDGSGTDLTSLIQFVNILTYIKSIAFRIRYNASSGIAYLTKLSVRGTPAKIYKSVNVEVSNAASISRYGTIIKEIENPYIDDETYATALAQVQLNMWANTLANFQTKVLALPWLQTGDIVGVQVVPEDDSNIPTWLITRCSWSWLPEGGATMTLNLAINYADYNNTEDGLVLSGQTISYTLDSGVYKWGTEDDPDNIKWGMGAWA